jgi:urease accessory protein
MTTSLRLWQLISPNLPVGGYSYSQGLEQVIAAGTLYDAASVQAWLADTLCHGLATTDLPMLLRVQRAWRSRDAATAQQLSTQLAAMRETFELRFGDLAMGAALARLLASLGVDVPRCELTFAAAFAVAAAHFDVPEAEACRGYAWSWSESQVGAAIKLVPLGHTAGQRMLLDLGPTIDAAVERALDCEDDAIGFSMPGAAIASALHETQYSRLFRS